MRLLKAVVLGAALTLALTMIGCSSDGDDEEMTAAPTETTAATATVEATATATPEPTATSTATPEPTAEPVFPATVGLATVGDLAPYLVDGNGRTLYVFADDEEGVSNCTGACLEAWPPFTTPIDDPQIVRKVLDKVTGELGVITLADGTMQVTYNGQPLYHFAEDVGSGASSWSTKGHGVGDKWAVAKPEGLTFE